jgi:DNA-binding SARP family transcriptional activator
MAAILAADGHRGAVAECEKLVAEEPLRERRWTQLMLALYRDGRQGEALEAFRRLRKVLSDVLGIDPGRRRDGSRHRSSPRIWRCSIGISLER